MANGNEIPCLIIIAHNEYIYLDRYRIGGENLAKVSSLIGVVVFLLVAAVIYPLINTEVTNMSNATHDDYVGADSESLVDMIPVFYWLAVLLAVIGFALVAIGGKAN